MYRSAIDSANPRRIDTLDQDAELVVYRPRLCLVERSVMSIDNSISHGGLEVPVVTYFLLLLVSLDQHEAQR